MVFSFFFFSFLFFSFSFSFPFLFFFFSFFLMKPTVSYLSKRSKYSSPVLFVRPIFKLRHNPIPHRILQQIVSIYRFIEKFLWARSNRTICNVDKSIAQFLNTIVSCNVPMDLKDKLHKVGHYLTNRIFRLHVLISCPFFGS